MVSTMKMVDTKSGGPFRVRVNRTGRRTYSREYKLEVVEECSAPGASVAGVALSRRINANLVRRWIVRQRRVLSGKVAESPAMLLPVSVQRVSPADEAPADDGMSPTTKPRRVGSAIEIELYGARIHLRGEVDAQALRAVLDVLSRR